MKEINKKRRPREAVYMCVYPEDLVVVVISFSIVTRVMSLVFFDSLLYRCVI